MWPLVVVLLLGSGRCGSAQLIFNVIKSVEYTLCNQTVVIPCFVNNVETKNITELYVRWKFKGENIFIFDGSKRMSKPSSNFSSAKITPSELLRGIASLKMDKSDAVLGNYTCEVTELSREGETIIELKYRVVSWFSPNENILIVIFPVLAILLFCGQFGIVSEFFTTEPPGKPYSLVFTQMELKTEVHTEIYTWMFIAALFIIAKIWKQTKIFFSRRMDKLWYIQSMEYYSALKTNELSIIKRYEGTLNIYS